MDRVQAGSLGILVPICFLFVRGVITSDREPTCTPKSGGSGGTARNSIQFIGRSVDVVEQPMGVTNHGRGDGSSNDGKEGQ